MTGATLDDLGCIHDGTFQNKASDCEHEKYAAIVRDGLLERLKARSGNVVEIQYLATETNNAPFYVMLRLKELQKEGKVGIDDDYAWFIGGSNQ